MNMINRCLISNIKLFMNKKDRFYSTINSAENDLKIEYLKQAFQPFNKPDNYYDILVSKYKHFSKTKRSAVLVPITIRLEKNSNKNYIQKSYFLFSKRTNLVNSFKGEVCFVGGHRDKSDKNDIDTALREAKEEIGIESNQVTIIAQLCPIITSKANIITPVIAYFDDQTYTPKINEHEVELIFELPTDRFLSNERHKTKTFGFKNNEYLAHYFDDIINDKPITTWGATAYMSIMISSIIHSRIPEFIIDKQIELNNDNIFTYMDQYLLTKSKFLI